MSKIAEIWVFTIMPIWVRGNRSFPNKALFNLSISSLTKHWLNDINLFVKHLWSLYADAKWEVLSYEIISSLWCFITSFIPAVGLYYVQDKTVFQTLNCDLLSLFSLVVKLSQCCFCHKKPSQYEYSFWDCPGFRMFKTTINPNERKLATLRIYDLLQRHLQYLWPI